MDPTTDDADADADANANANANVNDESPSPPHNTLVDALESLVRGDGTPDWRARELR